MKEIIIKYTAVRFLISILLLKFIVLPALAQDSRDVFHRKINRDTPSKKIKIGDREWGYREIKNVHDLLSPSALIPNKTKAEIIEKSGSRFKIQNQKPEKIYSNLTLNTESPYINAGIVENRSIFEVNSTGDMPYHFFNAKYFTNYGVFTARDNFDFRNYETYENFLGEIDVEPNAAKIFDNKQGAIVETKAPEIVNSYVRIHANKIKNQGRILGRNAANIELIGEEVDMRNGVVAITGSATYDSLNDASGNGFYWGDIGGWQGHRMYFNGTAYSSVYPTPPIPMVRPTQFVFTPQYGVINVYNAVIESIDNAGGWMFVNSSPGGFVDLSTVALTVNETSSQYPIIGSYNKPYGGQVLYPLYGLFGSQFTPYIWEDFFATGENEFTHVVQGIYVRQNGSTEVEYEGRIFPFVTSYNQGGDDMELWAFGAPVVEFKTKNSISNVVEGVDKVNSFYVIDETGSNEAKWNFGITNILSIPITPYLQPDSFTFTRFTPREFQEGEEPNASVGGTQYPLYYWESPEGAGAGHIAAAGVRFTNIMSRVETDSLSFSSARGTGSTNFVTKPGLSPSMITNFPWYGRSETPLPDLEGVGVLDQPGSIELKADELDLTQSRIRAEGGITIETKHLIGYSNLVLDCQNIILRLGKKEGILEITNMVPVEVDRFTGSMEVFSMAWNQGVQLESVNIKSKYFATVVDANMQITNKVTIPEAKFQSYEKVILGDSMHITDDLLIDSEHLEIHKDLRIGSDSGDEGVVDWDNKIAPKLLSLKILGNLFIPNNQNIGNFDTKLNTFHNKGSNIAYASVINTKNFINEGLMHAIQNINIKADNFKFDGSYTESLDLMTLQGGNAKFRNQTNIVRGKFSLNIKDNLSDGGVNANNYFQLWNDVQVDSLPTNSDLLGSTFHLISTNYAERIISWPAIDHGANEDGYKNNLALGSLVITNGFRGVTIFKGNSDEKNAIYVDYLEFEGRSESELYDRDTLINTFPEILLSENFSIYFASSNLPEEKLDGMYDGRLRWVKNYPGYKSSMPFYLTALNKTINVNKPFRQSLIDDTDRDGISNGFDLSPFGGGLPKIMDFELIENAKNTFSFEVLVVPDTSYIIEYKYNLNDDRWELFNNLDYRDMSLMRLKFRDTVSRKIQSKYYRVRIIN